MENITENNTFQADNSETIVNERAKEPLRSVNIKTQFDIFDTALACILFIVFNVLFSLALKYLNIKVERGSFGLFFLQALVEIVFAVAAAVVVITRKRNLILDTGMKNKVSGKLVALCLCVSVVSLACFGQLTNVFVEFLYLCGYKSILGDIQIATLAQYIGYAISSCAIAAFCEELLFRGVILSGLRKFGMRIAVIISALIFMLMHGNAEQTVHQFIIGLVVGYAFFATGNLWIGFFIHAFNNLIPITEVYLISLFPSSASDAAASGTTIGFGTVLIQLIFALLFAWAGLYFIKLLMKVIIKENTKLNGTKGENKAVIEIVIDGTEQNVEISIDGEPATNENTEKKCEKPKISAATITMFSLAGLYLVVEWILALVSGFLI